jgi:hypothetical protein
VDRPSRGKRGRENDGPAMRVGDGATRGRGAAQQVYFAKRICSARIWSHASYATIYGVERTRRCGARRAVYFDRDWNARQLVY